MHLLVALSLRSTDNVLSFGNRYVLNQANEALVWLDLLEGVREDAADFEHNSGSLEVVKSIHKGPVDLIQVPSYHHIDHVLQVLEKPRLGQSLVLWLEHLVDVFSKV